MLNHHDGWKRLGTTWDTNKKLHVIAIHLYTFPEVCHDCVSSLSALPAALYIEVKRHLAAARDAGA
jgi:hypothetical protein